MRFVIIGASGHHHQATDAMKLDEGKGFELLGVAKGSAGEDVSALARATGAKIYDSYIEMLEKTRPDVAVINPWFMDTAKISMECLKRGVHAYSEKPLAIDMDALRELRSAWQASGRELGGMLNLNCCGWFRTLEASIRNGDIGEVRTVHGQKSYRMGLRGANYQKRGEYGGTIPWVSIHAVDWVLRLGGKCKWVSAAHSRIANRGNGDMETTAAILLQLENGVIGTVDTDFLRPDGSARHDDDRVRVTGTRGMLEAIDGRVYLENESARRALAPLPEINPFVRFVNAIGTPEAKTLAEDAFEDTRICLLARKAADEETIIRA